LIETRLTKLLGIKYPIVQGALCYCSEDPQFVASVCNAGGLGIIATAMIGEEENREVIRKVRDLTDKPFGANLLRTHHYDRILDVMVEEKVPVFCHGKSDPIKAILRSKEINSLSIPTIGAVSHAVEAKKNGADALLVTGAEGGGHTSYVGTMVLIPAVIKATDIPVAVGGGISIPSQCAAALLMGADGIIMGTRFMATQESPLHPRAIEKLLASTENDTYATHHVTGYHQRWIQTDFFREKLVGLPHEKPKQPLGLWPWIGKGAVEGLIEEGMLGGGQGVGLIDDVPLMDELMEWLMTETEAILKKAPSLVS